MKTKLWEKELKTDSLIERFTIGKDQVLDLSLAKYDLLASRAHAKMLCKVGLINDEELKMLITGLEELEVQVEKGSFQINDGVEDVHSQIELYLTSKFGETGKKIHTARSRNDQVLTAIKLFLKAELQLVREKTLSLQKTFVHLAKKYRDVLMPGYTHFQVAMPSSFGLWLDAYAESLEDDLLLLEAAISICDKNPLGSAAGFGSSFPVDREFTTKELGFATLNRNSIYAQMTRGKAEKIAATGLAAIAQTIARFSYDCCLYLCQNFGFISFPDEFTTGSSIMPHKKNPDVFELLRGRSNLLQSLPNQLTLLTSNLPGGYHRDMQLTKELIIPAMQQIKDCLDVLAHTLPNLQVNANIIDDPLYDHLFSVEEVNRLVASGLPFRDAYDLIAGQIKSGSFNPGKEIKHTHTGSIGNH